MDFKTELEPEDQQDLANFLQVQTRDSADFEQAAKAASACFSACNFATDSENLTQKEAGCASACVNALLESFEIVANSFE